VKVGNPLKVANKTKGFRGGRRPDRELLFHEGGRDRAWQKLLGYRECKQREIYDLVTKKGGGNLPNTKKGLNSVRKQSKKSR